MTDGVAAHPARRGVLVGSEAEQHETHASVVRLAGDRAYKLRKPVRFPFLDQSSPAVRDALAREEVRINAELAPDTYLGVRAVEIGPDGTWSVSSPEAGPVDGGEVVVEMRRFAEADTLAARVARGDIGSARLTELGERLAAFHARAPRAGDGGVAAALARVHRNLEDLVTVDAPGLTREDAWTLARPLTTFAIAHAEAFEERAARGCWRDGHGDLRADHVVMDDYGLRIVDRLEFDPGLRADDVASDLAFLLMDLEARDAAWAADHVLAAYRSAGGDAGDDRLLAFWMAYRASVTAKVTALRAAQSGAAPCGVERRVLLARHLAWRTRGPLLVVVCGPPAAGKSTVAAELHRRSGLPVVSSDVVRKRRLGLPTTARAPAGAYTTAAKCEVYADLGRRAAAVLASGQGVIVDATMGTRELRAAFAGPLGDVAHRGVFVQCVVSEHVAVARAHARATTGPSASDATATVARRLRAEWAPLDAVSPADHVMVRADRAAGEVADEVERWLDEVP